MGPMIPRARHEPHRRNWGSFQSQSRLGCWSTLVGRKFHWRVDVLVAPRQFTNTDHEAASSVTATAAATAGRAATAGPVHRVAAAAATRRSTAGSDSSTRYGMASRKNRGPYVQPPHQWSKNEMATQCTTTTAAAT